MRKKCCGTQKKNQHAENVKCLLANGVVIHLPTLFKEMDLLEEHDIKHNNRIFISDRAQLVFDFHLEVDGMQETGLDKKKIGTTKRGIGPAYAGKMNRSGVRVGDLLYWDYFVERFMAVAAVHEKAYGVKIDVDSELEKYKAILPRVCPMILDGVDYLNTAIEEGKKILFEGANGVLLDIDFGTYPYVTSSSPGANGIPSGCGIRPALLAPDHADIVGVVKAYTTRVGEGPFPTELNDADGQRLQSQGHEYGTTTGRPRRCGYLDLVLVRFTNTLCGYTEINLTKLDVLSGFEELRICTDYVHNGQRLRSFPASLKVLSEVQPRTVTLPGWKENIADIRRWDDLPVNAQKYVETIEKLLGVPIAYIGVGPDRDAMIKKS
jgi:adenylosuccinate synthase